MGLLSKAQTVTVITGRRGGLLRRMILAVGELEIDQADSPAQIKIVDFSGGEGCGLLHKTLLIVDHPSDGIPADTGPARNSLALADYSLAAEALSTALEQAENDFSFFPAIFSLLNHELNLQASVLFVEFPALDSFVALLAEGVTGTRWWKWNLSGKALRELTGTGEKGFYPLTRPERLVSGTEKAFVPPVTVIPFRDDHKTIGCLMMNGLTFSGESASSFSDCVRRVFPELGMIVSRIMNRYSFCVGDVRVIKSPSQIAVDLEKEAKAGDAKILIATVPFSPIQEAIRAFAVGANVEKLAELALNILNAALSYLGAVAEVKNRDELVFFVLNRDVVSPSLLVRHLTGYLQEYFPGLFEHLSPLIVKKSVEFDPRRQSLPELLSEL